MDLTRHSALSGRDIPAHHLVGLGDADPADLGEFPLIADEHSPSRAPGSAAMYTSVRPVSGCTRRPSTLWLPGSGARLPS